MARGPQTKLADTDADGAVDTVEGTLLSSTPADDQASTVASRVVNSPPLNPQASDVDADADSTSGNQMVIYPVRSYLDGKEIRQAGGAGYASPKHEALLLIAKGLATDTDPKA